jgi:hypothetical protein
MPTTVCRPYLALLDAIMAGGRRIHKTEILQYNGTFLSLLGFPSFPISPPCVGSSRG